MSKVSVYIVFVVIMFTTLALAQSGNSPIEQTEYGSIEHLYLENPTEIINKYGNFKSLAVVLSPDLPNERLKQLVRLYGKQIGNNHGSAFIEWRKSDDVFKVLAILNCSNEVKAMSRSIIFSDNVEKICYLFPYEKDELPVQLAEIYRALKDKDRMKALRCGYIPKKMVDEVGDIKSKVSIPKTTIMAFIDYLSRRLCK